MSTRQKTPGIAEAIHALAARIIEGLFPEVTSEAALGAPGVTFEWDESDIFDLEGPVSPAISELAWQVARTRAMGRCGDKITSGDPGPLSACARDAMADTEIPIGSEDDIRAAMAAVGEDRFRDAINELGNVTDPYHAGTNMDGYQSWLAESGGLFDDFVAAMPTQTLGDQILVIGYSRGGVPVRAHLRSRPHSGGDGPVVKSEDALTAAAPAPTAQVFGAHADTPPPHMLTGVRFPQLVRLDEYTPDGRRIHSDGFSPRDLPLPFSAMFTTQHGDPGPAVITGSIDEVTIDNGVVSGRGWLLDETDARRAGRMIQSGAIRGNSVELAAEEVEWSTEGDETNMKMLTDFLVSKLAATTLVAVPAMEGCTVELEDPEFDFGVADTVTASLATFSNNQHLVNFSLVSPTAVVTEHPSHEWFEVEEPDTPHPIRVSGSGTVFGYLALWGTKHLSQRLAPPRSKTDYAYFATGEVLTDDGFAATGPLVIGGEHADHDYDWREAIDFYAATSQCWSDVSIRDGKHGIWVCGMVRPGTSDEQVHAGRASALSGDWRRIRSNLELVAALSVNTPGYPVPRPQAFAAAGRESTLLSAGALEPERPEPKVETFDANTDLADVARWARRQEAQAMTNNIQPVGGAAVDSDLRQRIAAEALRLTRGL